MAFENETIRGDPCKRSSGDISAECLITFCSSKDEKKAHDSWKALGPNRPNNLETVGFSL